MKTIFFLNIVSKPAAPGTGTATYPLSAVPAGAARAHVVRERAAGRRRTFRHIMLNALRRSVHVSGNLSMILIQTFRRRRREAGLPACGPTQLRSGPLIKANVVLRRSQPTKRASSNAVDHADRAHKR